MKDFANRLHGAAWVLYFWNLSMQDVNFYLIRNGLLIGVILYFFWFGTSRFEDKQYRKII